MIITRKNRAAQRPAVRALTESQKNGQRTRQAAADWKKLIESTKGFTPIKSKKVKETTAVLLENQMKWINENAPAMNTSIFGASNGLAGGALGNADTYATGDMRLPRVLLPMVRRIFPALMSNETVGVQPMMGPVALAYAIRYRYLKGANAYGDSSTEHIHRTPAADETKVTAQGRRGVECKATLTIDETDATKGTLQIVNESGYPEAVVVTLTEVTLTDSKVGVVTNPFGYLFQNTAGTSPAAGETLKAIVVGISALDREEGNTDRGKMHIDDVQWASSENGQKASFGNSEMGYHRLDTRFTGRADHRLGRKLANGRWQFRPEDTGVAATVHQFEATGAIARTAFGFEKQAVEAGTRRLSTSWTLETQEDLKNTNGIDIDAEATQQMSYELQAEIDREMVVRMLYSCLEHDEWSVWNGQLADARWLAERAQAFYQHLIKMSIRMRTRNRRGAANFIICTPDVVALLRCLDSFITMPVQSNLDGTNIQSAAAGTLGNNTFTVYVDDRTPVYSEEDYGMGYDSMYDPAGDGMLMPNYCMLGFKGADNSDAGIIYCPYVPIMVQTAVDPNSFAPHVGLMTRYGVMDNIFGSHLYYHLIIIDNFSNAGVPTEETKGVYPDGYLTATAATKNDEPYAPSYGFPMKDVPATQGN